MTIYPGGPQDSVEYVATAPDGSRASFNDPADADYVGMAWFTGLDSPDIREAIDVRAGVDGATQGLNLRGSRPVVGTVEIVASTTTDRNTKFQKLKRALNALQNDGTLTFTPDGGQPSQVRFRLNGPIRRSDERGWKYTVQFPMNCADPYIYGQTLQTATVSASPWQATITNQGDGLSAPLVDVTVAAAGPVSVTNQKTGLSVYTTSIDPSLFYNFSSQFGSAGSGNGQFSTSYRVAVDSSGNIYVADYGNSRIQKFNSAGVYQAQVGGYGTGNGQFSNIEGVACDSSGNVYAADYNNNRIQKFNSSLVYQAQVGSMGIGNGQFGGITGICVDASNNVWASDGGSRRIQKFNSSLVYQAQGAMNSSGYPAGLAADSSGNIFVADYTNHKVQKFNSSGTYQSSFGTPGSGNGQFAGPQDVAIDSSGRIAVVDGNNMRVQRFDSAGAYLSQFGSYGLGAGQFYYPSGIARTGTADFLVVDNNNRVQKWVPGAHALFDFGNAALTIGGQNAYQYIQVAPSTWWPLVPGTQTLLVTGGSAYTVSWRDAWL